MKNEHSKINGKAVHINKRYWNIIIFVIKMFGLISRLHKCRLSCSILLVWNKSEKQSTHAFCTILYKELMSYF